MINRFSRLLQALAPNTVPASGWFLAGWEPATALIVYWAENLIASVAIATRIVLHRRATRKRGHEGDFLSSFLTASLALTVVHGIFIIAILVAVMPVDLRREQIINGLRWMLIVQLATLAVDIALLRRWPFAEVRKRADWILGRVIVVHMAILVGAFLSAGSDSPMGILSVFIVLKTVVDIGTLLPQYDPAEAPRWMARIANRFPKKKGEEPFEEFWRKQHQSEQAKKQSDEEVLPLLD
jgi:hypothetical protein